MESNPASYEQPHRGQKRAAPCNIEELSVETDDGPITAGGGGCNKLVKTAPAEVAMGGNFRIISLSPELQAALQAMLDPMVVADRNGCILIFNNAASKLFGYQEREVVGQNVSMLMEESIAKVHHSFVENFLNSDRRGSSRIIGTPGREVMAQHKDGTLIPVWLTINYKSIAANTLFIACIRDLRETKRQQEQILKTNQRLRSVMRAMLDPMIVINGEGTMLVYNQAAAKVFGYSEEEALGMNVTMLMTPDISAIHDSFLQRYLRTGQANIIGTAGREVVGRHKDGSLIPVLLSVNDSSTNDGDITFTGCIHDLRKLKQREIALERANALMRSSMEAMLDPLVIADRSGFIVMLNPAASKLFGYAPAEIIGQNLSVLCDPKIAPYHDSFIRNYLETGQARIIGKQSRDVVARKKDGSLVPMLLSVSESKGDPHLFVGCIHDLSKLKKSEHELEETQGRLAQAVQDVRTAQKALQRQTSQDSDPQHSPQP